ALAQADPSGAALHAALVHGFGWVMVYGAAGVAVLATASAVAFAPARRGAAVCE
ncbi:MFS transporter, partial [Burkholderia cenocepacia]|nr:MFS transporter [Burkholderia cenocepacia]